MLESEERSSDYCLRKYPKGSSLLINAVIKHIRTLELILDFESRAPFCWSQYSLLFVMVYDIEPAKLHLPL